MSRTVSYKRIKLLLIDQRTLGRRRGCRGRLSADSGRGDPGSGLSDSAGEGLPRVDRTTDGGQGRGNRRGNHCHPLTNRNKSRFLKHTSNINICAICEVCVTFHDAKLLHRHGFTTTFLSSLRPCSTFHAITRYESWECLPRLVPMPCTTRSDAFHTYMGMPSTTCGRHRHDPWKASPSGFPEVIDDQADL